MIFKISLCPSHLMYTFLHKPTPTPTFTYPSLSSNCISTLCLTPNKSCSPHACTIPTARLDAAIPTTASRMKPAVLIDHNLGELYLCYSTTNILSSFKISNGAERSIHISVSRKYRKIQ